MKALYLPAKVKKNLLEIVAIDLFLVHIDAIVREVTVT